MDEAGPRLLRAAIRLRALTTSPTAVRKPSAWRNCLLALTYKLVLEINGVFVVGVVISIRPGCMGWGTREYLTMVPSCFETPLAQTGLSGGRAVRNTTAVAGPGRHRNAAAPAPAHPADHADFAGLQGIDTDGFLTDRALGCSDNPLGPDILGR